MRVSARLRPGAFMWDIRGHRVFIVACEPCVDRFSSRRNDVYYLTFIRVSYGGEPELQVRMLSSKKDVYEWPHFCLPWLE